MGEFVVDDYDVEEGMKVDKNMKKDNGEDINVKEKGGIGVDVKFGLKVKKKDVIKIKYEVLKNVNESGKYEVDNDVKFKGKKRRE